MSKNLLNFANFSRTNKDDLCKLKQTTFLTALLTLPIEFVYMKVENHHAKLTMQKQFIEFVFRPFDFGAFLSALSNRPKRPYEVKSHLRL